MTTPPRRGRPPLDWIPGDRLAGLRPGTALVLDLIGRHERLLGRLAHGGDAEHFDLVAADGTLHQLHTATVRRGRIVDALYEPGDAVLRRDVPVHTWRGGVVRCGADQQVLVEQIAGDFAWFAEADLEPAEARTTLPTLRRGRVPARTG